MPLSARLRSCGFAWGVCKCTDMLLTVPSFTHDCKALDDNTVCAEIVESDVTTTTSSTIQ